MIRSTEKPVTSSGTEPETFWLVGQCLNQLHYHMLRTFEKENIWPEEGDCRKLINEELHHQLLLQ
jgi:hypothetical protein